MNPQYVVAECRPCEENDEYADLTIDDVTYIFEAVEPAEDIKSAILITLDIERSRPANKHVVLHHESLLKLINGINGIEYSSAILKT